MAGEQPDLFHHCAWCGDPGVVEIELEPAVIRKGPDGVAKVIKRPITAWGCDRHKHVAERADQAGNLNYRRIKDRHAEQLEMLGQQAKRPRSAIDGDAA